MSFISDWLELPVIEVDKIQCLNAKSPNTVCERCIQVCPSQALSIKDGDIHLREKHCIDCSACVSACPTLSIDYAPKTYSKLINEITAFPTADITCNQFEKYQKGIKIPCYHSIDYGVLMHYFTANQGRLIADESGEKRKRIILEMYTGNCSGCKYKEHFTIEDHIRKLQQWYKTIQLPLKIKTTDDAQKFLSKQADAVAGMTRRSLFKSLSLRSFKEPEPEARIEGDILSYQQKNHYKRVLINRGMEALREIKLQQAKDDSSEPIMLPGESFALVAKSEACRKCNICMRVCPTEALEWKDTENKAELLFYPQKCIACGRCEICPEKSITMGPITMETYFNQEVIPLISLAVKTCTDCKDTFIPGKDVDHDETLCYLCKMKEEKKRALFDSL